MKDKFINFRASEKEKKQLTILAKRAKLSQAEFIRHAVFDKEIVVIDGLKPLQAELKRIGNNLNQITTRSNMGHFSVINLQETKEQLGKIYEVLADLCVTKDEELAVTAIEKDTTTHQPDAPNQCNSSEDGSPKQDFISKDKSNDEQIVHRQNSDNPIEQITPIPPLPKLGERRNGSVFGNVFNKNRGD